MIEEQMLRAQEGKQETSLNKTLSRICKFAYCSLTNSTLSQRERVKSRVDFSLPEKLAFTLAEVLITLGIIGIVAAMTLPPLVSNYRKKALQTALLKTYSELQQVNQQLISEGNDLMDTETYEVSRRVELVMGKFNGKYVLDGTKDSQTAKERLKAIYHNKGLYYSDRTTYAHPSCDNSGVWTDNQGRLWLFNDTGRNICVDINGTKGPNAIGYDYFVFVPKNNSIIPHQSTNENGEPIVDYEVDYTYFAVTDQHPTEKGKTYWKDYLKY